MQARSSWCHSFNGCSPRTAAPCRTPVDDFLSNLTTRKRSPNTVQGYAYDLADFFEWLDQRSRDFKTLTLEQLGEFFEWLRKPRETT
jgi:site-specific recombinase XerD